MVSSPAILALLASSLCIVLALIYASANGVRILRRWDPSSGSSLQLELERRTSLVSSILAIVLAAEILSLFLFIRVGDELHPLFTGAMCGAGTFNVNAFGYPALVLKAMSALACGVWLVINYADSLSPGYPLLLKKYRLLLPLTVLVIGGHYLQTRYFLGMEPDIITSCCGALFNEDSNTLAGNLAALPPRPLMAAFFLSVILLARAGVRFLSTGRGAVLFSWLAFWLIFLSLASVLSFISVFYYQLPTHHCPFCLLQREYLYIGYPLYAALLMGGISGSSLGALTYFAGTDTLREILPALQRRLCLVSMVSYILVAAIAAYPLAFSDFKISGYQP